MVAAYLDPQREPAERLDDLVERMTLEEKIAQLRAFDMAQLGDAALDPARLQAELPLGVGYATGVGALAGDDPARFADAVNTLQRTLQNDTRLGIPALVLTAPRTGVYTPGGCRFPGALALAATFNPVLVRDLGWAVRAELVALGVGQLLGPSLDLGSSADWGALGDTFGDDPYLVGRMGVALLRGLQGDRLDAGVLATARTFPGCTGERSGRAIGDRELRERYVEPFAAAIREGGLHALVCANEAVDGVPVAASARLLRTLLREALGFRGVVLADPGDGGAVSALATRFGVAADAVSAAREAMLAGVDVDLPDGRCYAALEPANADRALDELIDEAVRRVLAQKFALGLFDECGADAVRARAVRDIEAHGALAARLAEESTVLLSNSGVLPLAAGRRLAVVGSAPAELLECLAARVAALREHAADDFTQIEGSADTVLLCLDDAGPGDEGVTAGGRLLGAAEALLVERAAASGLPVVVVAFGDAIGALPELRGLAAAMLAVFSGVDAPRAVANVLTGAVNPSGRLPLTISAASDEGGADGREAEVPAEGTFAFGHGLSFSTFSYSELTCPDAVDVHSAADVSVSVRNDSELAGEEVVQLYVSDRLADVARPARQLAGLQRVWLEPGEARRVSFRLDVTQLAYFDRDMEYVVDAGEVDILVASSRVEVHGRRRLMVTGERRVLRQQQRVATQVQIVPS